MGISAAEQYGIELINRARLDPAAEAKRYGISLNKGLSGEDRITTAQKQVVAPNQFLSTSAEKHSGWMLKTDAFSHTGINGTDPGDRMAKAGYKFNTPGWSWSENIVMNPLGGMSAVQAVMAGHRLWMLSPDHRENIMHVTEREVGYGQVFGSYNGTNASMMTQNFGYRSTDVFVTGVAYTDKNDNSFYNVGEGRGGIRFEVAGGGAGTGTMTAGGYALKVGSTKSITIDVGDNGSFGTVKLTSGGGNIKLDLVDKDTVFVAANADIIDGINNIRLLGINNNSISGSDEANRMTGNKGNNTIKGEGGNDTLLGGDGKDRLDGGAGDDFLTGGNGADQFVFGARCDADVITDFKPGQGDRLLISDALAKTAQQAVGYASVEGGKVVFDFDNGNTVTLNGISSLNNLESYITII